MDSSDSVDTISSDSDDVTLLSSDPPSEAQSPLAIPEAKLAPVYVQSQMSKSPAVTSAARPNTADVDRGKVELREATSSDAKVSIISSRPASSIRPTLVGPVANGVFGRKITPGGASVTYVSSVGVWPSEKRKVILTSMKKDNEYHATSRMIVPSSASSIQGTSVSSVARGNTGALSVVLPQGSNKLSKGYIVSPSSVGAKGGTVSILPRNALYIDGTQPKFVSGSLIRPKEGRIISAASLRPMNLLNPSSGRVISASSLPPGYNLIAYNKQRPSIPGKPFGSVVTTSGERRVLIGNPTSQLKVIPQEQVKKIAAQEQKKEVAVNISTEKPTTFKEIETGKSSDSETAAISESPSTKSVLSKSELSSSNDGAATVLDKTEHSKTEERSNLPAKSLEDSGTLEDDTKLVIDEQQAIDITTSATTESAPEVVTIDDEPAAEPLEKQSALRKAKILSFPKHKPKHSLLNGMRPQPAEIPFVDTIVMSPTSNPERVRKRKDNHRPAVIGEPPQKLVRAHEALKPISGAESVHPHKVIKWDGNGMGVLPGSTLKLMCNEFGMIEVLPDLLANKVEYEKDTKNGELRIKKRDPSEIYCCTICSCYGLLSEFYNENFCSVVCWDTFSAQRDAISKKIEDKPTLTLIRESKPSHTMESSSGDVEPKKRKRLPAHEDTTGDVDVGHEPPVKQKKVTSSSADVEESASLGQKSSESASKAKNKMKAPPPSKDKAEVALKPFIKLKSMDSLAGSPSSGRQLRARESLAASQKRTTSKFIVGQDLGGIISDDDEKIKGDQMDPFPWSEYLAKTETKATWVKLFANPFPTANNLFKIGFKLEAIDPERQGFICAATVADVQGHRIKVHFDGYSNKYDFWTNIDSPNILPCGFCERHEIALQPPAGIKKSYFSWQSYHSTRKSRPAPLNWFNSYRMNSTSTNMFRYGMKLEAVDRKNTQLVCVATVAGVIDNRILVHFDSWSDVYDYWVDTSSPYIHPVGWCAQRKRELTPPNGYSPAIFSWEAYLKEMKAEAAPTAAFTLRPPKEFKRGTKLEAIDKRAPHLLRVATIKEVLPYQIRIVFDGFPDHFGYWCDDDSSDIHPVNWGLKTGHPVAGPPDVRQVQSSRCPTPGCIGDGNFKGLMAELHSNLEECPYTMNHLSSESPLQDRLSSKLSHRKKIPALGHDSNSESEDDGPGSQWKFLDNAMGKCASKSRMTLAGTMVNAPNKASKIVNLPPAHQNFRSNNRVVNMKPEETVKALPIKRDSDVCKIGKQTQSKSLERRASDKNIKPPIVSSRVRTQSVKSTTTAQTASPVKGAQPASEKPTESGNSQNKAVRKSTSTLKTDILDRRSKVLTEERGYTDHDVVLWNKQKCLEKIQELGCPRIHTTFENLCINGGKMLMIDSSDLQFRGLLSVAESKTMSGLVSDLRKAASFGLDLWKKVESVQ